MAVSWEEKWYPTILRAICLQNATFEKTIRTVDKCIILYFFPTSNIHNMIYCQYVAFFCILFRLCDYKGRIGALDSVSASIGLSISSGFSQINLCVPHPRSYWHDIFTHHVDSKWRKIRFNFRLLLNCIVAYRDCGIS